MLQAQVSGVMEHHPLLPSMSLDSFLNFVEDPAGTHGEAPAKAAMLRQVSAASVLYPARRAHLAVLC